MLRSIHSMSSDLFTAAASILLLSSAIFYLLRKMNGGNKRRKLNLPPSPPSLPLVGNLFQMSKLPFRSLRTLSKTYGPLMMVKLGSVPYLIVSSPDAVQELTDKDHDLAFSGRPKWKASDALFGGGTDIIFSSYGEYWRQMKKICMVEVLSQRRVNQFRYIREQEVEHLVGTLKDASEQRIAVDLSHAISSFANAVVSRAAFGKKYNGTGGELNDFAPLLNRALDLLAKFCFEDMLPLLGWVDALTGLDAEIKRVAKEVNDFLDRVVDDHKSANGADRDHLLERQDVVDILLRVQKEGAVEFDFTDANIKATLLDMFAGGTETIATTLDWVMSELVRHPSVMKRAQEEVRKVVLMGAERDKSVIYEADINQMEYLQCVVKESLRLHPPAPMSVRRTSGDAQLKGYDIPEGTMVMVNLWAIMRDPEIWDDPEEFVPERFLAEPLDFKGQTGKFLPFGVGRRLCPGITMAVVEVGLVAANLLCWFDWELPEGVEDLDMRETSSVVLRRETPLFMVPVLNTS